MSLGLGRSGRLAMGGDRGGQTQQLADDHENPEHIATLASAPPAVTSGAHRPASEESQPTRCQYALVQKELGVASVQKFCRDSVFNLQVVYPLSLILVRLPKRTLCALGVRLCRK